MAKAPELKYITQGVTDLQYANNFFSDFLNFKKIKSSGLKNSEFKFNLENENTSEFISIEGGAFVQFIEDEKSNLKVLEPDLSEIGIIGLKIKTRKIDTNFFMRRREDMFAQEKIWTKPLNRKHFHIHTENLLFQIIDSKDNFFAHFGKFNSGIEGAIIGVSDIQKSAEFYKNILGYNKVIFKEEGIFNDFKNIKGGDRKYKRMILQQSENQNFKYRYFLGNSEIELLQFIGEETSKTPDFEYASLNFITSNINDIVGRSYNDGILFQEDKKDKSILHFLDPDGIKISVQKIEETSDGLIPNDLKLLFKLIKK